MTIGPLGNVKARRSFLLLPTGEVLYGDNFLGSGDKPAWGVSGVGKVNLLFLPELVGFFLNFCLTYLQIFSPTMYHVFIL
jgi:hypothetical protein